MLYPPATVGAPGILTSVSYNPASTDVATASGTFADVSAGNLFVTFTFPASGAVVVRMSARTNVGANTEMSWNLRTPAGADVAASAGVVTYDSTSNSGHRATLAVKITGTPGAGATFRWGHARTFGAGACNTSFGGAQGPALMEVMGA